MDLLSGTVREASGETFRGLAFDAVEIAGVRFEGCTFTRCEFTETVLRACSFLDCTFTDCRLNLVRVPDSSFRAVRFERSQVIGVNWAEGAWNTVGLPSDLHFAECALNHSVFMGLTLGGLVMRDCVARHVEFSEADLTGVDLRGTDFTGTRFLNTNLTRADLTRATNYTIDAAANTLKGAKFSLPEAMSLLYSLDIEIVEG